MKDVALAAMSFMCLLLVAGCNHVDDDRIPALPVSINLQGAGVWNTYGVAGFGLHREFIRSEKIPL